MSDFVHLHVHGQHSLLDGLTKPDEAVTAALADGQPAIALTDHGSLGGTLKFADAAEKAGLKFIPGQEMYLSLGPRGERNTVDVPADDDFDGTGGATSENPAGPRTKRKVYEHLTVLAANPTGWANLMIVDNAAYDSFWQRPRADYELLGEHAEGLIAGTGCLGGPVAGQLLQGNPERAEQNLRALVDVFGTPNVFVEVMDHGIAAEQRVVGGLVDLARRYGLPVIATNDAHYSRAEQAGHHDAWLCVAQSKGTKTVLVDDAKRWRFQGAGYHLRTAAEMHALFDAQPGTGLAVRNSLLVAERCEDRIVQRTLADHHRIPVYPVGPGQTLERVFHERVLAGLVERYGTPLPAEVRARARFEEDTIASFGVMAYYLTIADVIAAEKAAGGLVGAGRGSGPGSICAYALGITRLDPLRHGLLFERFLNPTRKALPDFDTDFQSSRQRIVLDRAADTYGRDRVARIGTYGQSWTKAALKQMGRVTGADQLANRLANTVPADGDPKKTTIAKLMNPATPEGSELRGLVAEVGEEADRLLAAAHAVEGSAANETIHACGVVISDEPLPGTVPLRRIDPKDGGDPFPVTQWDAGDCEAANFVKFDFLAISDLDVVAGTARLVEESTGERVDVERLDADGTDERSMRAKGMLAEGRTAGVFQLAGTGITELTRDIRPESYDDLAAILALYRPGPMGADQHNVYARRRRGGEPVDYGIFTPVPAEQQIIAGTLDRSLGSLCYQEQLMQLARDIADFDGGQMKDLQAAFSKKKQALMDGLKSVFFTGGTADRRRDGSAKVPFRRQTLESLWRAFEASGSYLFNASHSYAYAYLTWQTAYLKANWPAQFGAALLANTAAQEKRGKVLADLVAEGIVVRPPSIIDGKAGTSVSGAGEVVLGLAEIKDVGDIAHTIIAERDTRGPFTGLADLSERCKLSATHVQALAESGALDHFGARMGLVMAARAARVPGLAVPDCEWGVLERGARQRARLGLSLGDHPLEVLHDKLCASSALDSGSSHRLGLSGAVTGDYRESMNVKELHVLPRRDGAKVDTIGVVARAGEFVGRHGRRLSMVVDSAKTQVECVMWPDQYLTWRAKHDTPRVGQLVGITGRVRLRVPVSTDEGNDGAPLEPVVGLVADRIWDVLVDDPGTPLQPAPGTPAALVRAARPVLVPGRAGRSRKAVTGDRADLAAVPGLPGQPPLVDAPAGFTIVLPPVQVGRSLNALMSTWPRIREVDRAGGKLVEDWYRAARPGDETTQTIAGVDIVWRVVEGAGRRIPKGARDRLLAAVTGARTVA